MFLSTLLIDTGINPDRPRPGRIWLRNLYRVHQRLCMAFPSKERRESDPSFLKQYEPAQFAQGHVHVRRKPDAGFLFRVDPRPGGSAAIVVLSAVAPNWGYAFHNAQFLLAAPPSKPRLLQLPINEGARFAFRLLANAVFRAREKSLGVNGAPLDAKWVCKRIPVPGDEESLRNWLKRRAAGGGFSFEDADLAATKTGYVYVNKRREDQPGYRLRSVQYDVVLKVTDTDAFRQTLARGIGPGKAFGFGLLSIAPVDP